MCRQNTILCDSILATDILTIVILQAGKLMPWHELLYGMLALYTDMVPDMV